MNPTPEKHWFSARCIFLHRRYEIPTYEERVVMLLAVDFDDAIAKAEEEALQYVEFVPGCTYLNYVDVFDMKASSIGHASEIYSLMRRSHLPPESYVDHFFDTGSECSKKMLPGTDG